MGLLIGFVILHRLYRAKIVFEIQRNLNEEIMWLNGIALAYQKNYQIWYASLQG